MFVMANTLYSNHVIFMFFRSFQSRPFPVLPKIGTRTSPELASSSEFPGCGSQVRISYFLSLEYSLKLSEAKLNLL